MTSWANWATLSRSWSPLRGGHPSAGASTTPTIPCQNPGAAFTSTANSAILDQIRPFRGYRSIAIITPYKDQVEVIFNH